MAHTIFFYTFSAIAIISAIMVTVSKNTVHSVFFLILDFISISCLFIMIGAEFLGMIMLIVYVGAVAVLFLFVVMMLDVDFAELKAEMARYLPLWLLIGVIVLMQLLFAFGVWDYSSGYEGRIEAAFGMNTNSAELGAIIYDKYILIFQLSGLILLVAMIGAIVLTLRHRKDIKRQDVVAQMMRDPEKAMELRDVKPGQGL